MKHYQIYNPQAFYATDIYATSKKEAIRIYKENMGINRLPNGTAVLEVGKE